MKHTGTLYLIGVPLDESGSLAPSALNVLSQVSLIIGETPKIAMRFIKQADGAEKTPRYFLDRIRPFEWEEVKTHLERIAGKNGSVALFSDTGMPILFDPGLEVLEHSQALGFEIRSVPGPTSWATAMAVSGFSPPFYVAGFPPQKTELRQKTFHQWKQIKAKIVLMDTPYRFQALLKEALSAFGQKGQAFLAWEIAKPAETFLWGTLGDIAKEAGRRQLDKGEFVLIVESSGR